MQPDCFGYRRFLKEEQIRGSLFTQDFLEEGIGETPKWMSIGRTEFDEFRANVRVIFDRFPVKGNPNEPTTEQDLIYPVLRALDWEHFLPQQTASRRREDVPDALLFADAEAKRAANRERHSPARYRHGIAILENKAWDLALDRGPVNLFNQNAPSTQMLRYLSRVEIESERAIQWGILTNGRLWRLYFQSARSRAEDFLELDLPLLLGVPEVEPDLFSPERERYPHLLKVFYIMFRRDAFLPSADDARTFHHESLELTREWEAKVSQDLSKVVFGEVFRNLINTLVASDPKAPVDFTSNYLADVRQGALTLLYRFLFVLYAEDRNLLPSHQAGYSDYSLRKIRQELRARVDRAERFSARASTLYERLRTLFHLIEAGDAAIGLPAYNGGLFDDRYYPLLHRVALPDAQLAPILDALSRRWEGGVRKWINYRDLSVQHLGSIYERLLEYIIVQKDRQIVTQLDPFARRASGSYYTHEDIVKLILDRTVAPLIEERLVAFRKRAAALAGERTLKTQRINDLKALDPAVRILDLKICDPAMGSGHFLVSLVDYLADAVLEAMADSTASVSWADADHPYVSPLASRIALIRVRILDAADREGWHIERAQLDDRHIVRRMILKRNVYGVDKNPMAVELAKVALWLHTFTAGAPLSFLDHHLRCGDSLFGERVGHVMTTSRGSLLVNRYVQQAKRATVGMAQVEEATDADIVEVRSSDATFAGVSADTGGLRAYLDFVHALRWLALEDKADAGLVQSLLDGQFGDTVKLIAGEVIPALTDDAATQVSLFARVPGQQDLGTAPVVSVKVWNRLKGIIDRARTVASDERFLHWEVAFPGVWTNWESVSPEGGFDAMIGNPPWDRIKLQEVEWFATHRPEIAQAVRASDRKGMIAELERKNDPVWRDYLLVRERAGRAAAVARSCGYYPFLSSGDINIYALFVERGHELIKPDGIVGLLVPSGIAGDKSSSVFFKSVSTAGRLGALLDFENRGIFFPDVHRSFKFCAFVSGGQRRRFQEAHCAFFLHGTKQIAETGFSLTAEDFSRVNPNTGTAPVFRTPRDAQITRGIYERLPVLVRHTSGIERPVWPLRYIRMLDLTNDSGLFKTHEELEQEGFYRTTGNRLRRGNDEYLALYEGKMVQAFDHRAANVVVNINNVSRPAQPEPPKREEKTLPWWLPLPQFWVRKSDVEWIGASQEDILIDWCIGFKDVTAPTNIRTMIAAAVPFAAFGNTLPVIYPKLPSAQVTGVSQTAEVVNAIDRYRKWAPLLLANFNSFPFDFTARQKVQGQHLNWYIVEQLPVIPEGAFEEKIGSTRIGDLVRDEVLHLTYTSHDMAGFARDMGYHGEPFPWDEEDRMHRRARLDALFFRLYGIEIDDAAYILDTFPIVQQEDQVAFARFQTKELVTGYMRAFAAGDLKSRIAS